MFSNKESMVYKSNALVQASYRLSVAEQRILLSCISQVRRDRPITDETRYSVSAIDIAQLSGTSVKQAYQELEKAALRLKRREVRIDQDPNGMGHKKTTMVTCWVQTIFYVEKEGRIELRFSKDMLPYLTKISKEFTKYALSDVAKMTSSYAIHLYELLTQWKKKGGVEIEIDKLRELFQLSGSYKAIKDLKRRVIEPSVDQINKLSNLKVSYIYKKTGRKITHIQFTLKKNDIKLERKIIQALALPGESWDEATKRLQKKML